MKMVPPVVIDCDPGIDDSMALILAIRAAKEGFWDLKAITIVHGNTPVDNACVNALRVLEATNFNADVHRGCGRSMVIKSERRAGEIPFHGFDGFGDMGYPQPKDFSLWKKDVHAIDKLIQLSKDYKGELVVIALGPLTNIAMAMRTDEHFAGRLKELHVMGGNTQGVGNIISSAEFNFWGDPEAAYVVLNTVKCPLYLVPYELCFFHCRQPMTWRKEVLAKIDSKEAKLMNLIEHKHVYSDNPISDVMQKNGYLMYDQVSVAVALKPTIATRTKNCRVSVELAGYETRGQMVIDHRGLKNLPPNVTIIEELDISDLLEIIQWGLYCPNTKVHL